MITLLIIALVKIITWLGIGALLAIVCYVAFITFKFIIGKIKEFLTKRFGGTVAVVAISSLVEEIAKEKQRSENTVTLSQLEKELGNEGVVIAPVDEDGKVVSDDLEIIKADDMEDNLKISLKKRNGVMVVTN